MREITVKLTDKSYPIQIKRGLFEEWVGFIQRFFSDSRVFIVTDSNIAAQYQDILLRKCRGLHEQPALYVIPAGEESKSHLQLLKLYDAFASSGVTRRDVIAAFGGGVTGDLSGFAASTWLRGTGFVQIPTSLLAMVDSSIGGKVAVNLSSGKNLVGNFYHPSGVLIDPLLLNTLPDRHFADGMAEVIKYGCIWDAELFSLLEGLKNRAAVMEQIEEIIFRCCDIKRQVVEQDEKENNLRMILNFGHTFGHAIERVFRYERYTHGEAISMGMVFIAELSCQLGFCNQDIPERIRSLLEQFGLPVDWPEMDANQVLDTVLLDKKARTDALNLVLIKQIGQTTIEKYPKCKITDFIKC